MKTVTLSLPLTFTADQFAWLLRDLGNPEDRGTNWSQIKKQYWNVGFQAGMLEALEKTHPQLVADHRRMVEIMSIITGLWESYLELEYANTATRPRVTVLGEDGIWRDIAYTLRLKDDCEFSPEQIAMEYNQLVQEWKEIKARCRAGGALPGERPSAQVYALLQRMPADTKSAYWVRNRESREERAQGTVMGEILGMR